MVKRRRKYDKEFKLMAVELMNTNKSVREISEELGVKKDLLYQWRRELIRKGEAGFSVNGKKNLTPQEAEIARLKKELREAELERDILKKAVSIPVCRQAGSPRTMANISIHKGSLLHISH